MDFQKNRKVMNRKIKLSIALCGLGIIFLVGTVNASTPKKIRACVGKDTRVCFTDGDREYYGVWVEITSPIEDPTKIQ